MKDERNERLRVQRRLIGLAAEKRIASATVDTRMSGFAEVIEARYLVGAGVGSLHVGTPEATASARSLDPCAHVSVPEGRQAIVSAGERNWNSPEACAFREGAASALRTLMEVMGLDVPTNA